MGNNKLEFARRFVESLELAGMADWSDRKVGERLGVSGPTVWNYRHGEKLPSMDTAMDIARITGVQLEWLMMGRGSKTGKDAALDYLDISMLPEGSKVAMRATVHALAEQSPDYGQRSKKAN